MWGEGKRWGGRDGEGGGVKMGRCGERGRDGGVEMGKGGGVEMGRCGERGRDGGGGGGTNH